MGLLPPQTVHKTFFHTNQALRHGYSVWPYSPGPEIYSAEALSTFKGFFGIPTAPISTELGDMHPGHTSLFS
jgi:hypothetical protein